ncbi:MAG: hypothetical protein LBD31_07435 [Treponema sp.]|jgi:tetratricopeptide (TPR) repeat protein|nr:hypothetical protein [Treponema sp.]
MALFPVCAAILLTLLLPVRVFSRDFAPALLAAEIESAEKRLGDASLAPAERRETLVSMARLLELSGSAGDAARFWNEAARVLPGPAASEALLRSALCLAAMGEFDRAAAALRPVLAGEGRTLIRARLLLAQIGAFKSGGAGTLTAILSDPAYGEWKPALYYSIWRISGEEAAKKRLLEEFPQSPEARIARDSSGASPVSAIPSPMWLLMGFQPVPALSGPLLSGESFRESFPNPEPGDPRVSAADGGSLAGPSLLQTGLFGREENALALAERLHRAGFGAQVAGKTVNGREYWVVGVDPGPDPSRTMLLLKDRGFESFPVY